MDQTNETNLDCEFKWYLQILRPHLCQLLDQDIIDLCNAWIQRLSNCEKNEKVKRNKYIFALCYQVAKGVLDEPFLRLPPKQDLKPLLDDANSDNSFAEVECLVIDSKSTNTNILYKQQTPSRSYSDSSRIDVSKNKDINYSKSDVNISHKENLHEENCIPLEPYNYSIMNDIFTKFNKCDENYNFRANNLIMKLREIKQQNILLHNELLYLKEECKRKDDFEDSLHNSNLKIDNATITYHTNDDSSTTLTSLKCKLQEIQYSRNNLIKTVDSLQDKLDKLNELKNYEIAEIEAKHKLEIIKLRSDIREEVKMAYEMKLDGLKKEHDDIILKTQRNNKDEIDSLNNNKEEIIVQKDKLLQNKEDEIRQLKHQLDEFKCHQSSVLNKLIDTSNEKSTENVIHKSHDLEKQLNKIEKTKYKCARAYEARIVSLKHEKHLTECSLQLQLIKQRAQVVNELTDENQLELVSAAEKLENKYKEIVGNIQATALQRRLQDQIAFETLVNVICGVQNEKPNIIPTNENTRQFPGITIRNQTKNRNQTRDREIETLCNSNRADNVQVGNKSFGEDSLVTGYCLDNEKLQELFERVQIPQRDVTNLPK